MWHIRQTLNNTAKTVRVSTFAVFAVGFFRKKDKDLFPRVVVFYFPVVEVEQQCTPVPVQSVFFGFGFFTTCLEVLHYEIIIRKTNS